jgi:hypothetical protein
MGCRCRGKAFVAVNRVLLVLSNVLMKLSRMFMFMSLCVNIWVLSSSIIFLSPTDVCDG